MLLMLGQSVCFTLQLRWVLLLTLMFCFYRANTIYIKLKIYLAIIDMSERSKHRNLPSNSVKLPSSW